MGWASGSGIAEDVWEAVKKYIPKEDLKKVAGRLIDIFEAEDCDTMQETSFYELVWKYDEKTEEWIKRK